MPRELPPSVAECVRVYREARKAERTAREAFAQRPEATNGTQSALDLIIASGRATAAASDAYKALETACREAGMDQYETMRCLVGAGRDDSLH